MNLTTFSKISIRAHGEFSAIRCMSTDEVSAICHSLYSKVKSNLIVTLSTPPSAAVCLADDQKAHLFLPLAQFDCRFGGGEAEEDCRNAL